MDHAPQPDCEPCGPFISDRSMESDQFIGLSKVSDNRSLIDIRKPLIMDELCPTGLPSPLLVEQNGSQQEWLVNISNGKHQSKIRPSRHHLGNSESWMNGNHSRKNAQTFGAKLGQRCNDAKMRHAHAYAPRPKMNKGRPSTSFRTEWNKRKEIIQCLKMVEGNIKAHSRFSKTEWDRLPEIRSCLLKVTSQEKDCCQVPEVMATSLVEMDTLKCSKCNIASEESVPKCLAIASSSYDKCHESPEYYKMSNEKTCFTYWAKGLSLLIASLLWLLSYLLVRSVGRILSRNRAPANKVACARDDHSCLCCKSNLKAIVGFCEILKDSPRCVGGQPEMFDGDTSYHKRIHN